MLSIGKQLFQAREARGLTISDVAFQTHVPGHLLQDMENDDLSNFGNLTYAKSFLKLYSRHLDLDISDYLEQFDTRALSEATGHEYAQHAGFTRSFAAPMISSRPSRVPLLVVLIGIALSITFIVWFGKWISRRFDSTPPAPPVAAAPAAPATFPAPEPPGPEPAMEMPAPQAESTPPPRAEALPEDEDVTEQALDSDSTPIPAALHPEPEN